MNIAVVEDSRREAEELIRFLEQYGKKHGCDLRISYYMNGEDFLASLGKNDYTAVFLDIFLGKMSGMEAAGRLWEYNPQCQIIFLTSSREHIRQAFQVHCFDYIDKKDFTCERIFEVMEDLRRKLPSLNRYLEFVSGNRSVRLPMNKIQHVLSDNNYTVFVMEDGKEYRYRIPFGNILELMEPAENFLNCNRGVLLNMNDIVKEEADVYVMKSGQRFPIRRLDRALIKDRYHQYQFAKLEEM
jgi:DNA-binding LytR/AlgR family response regulator